MVKGKRLEVIARAVPAVQGVAVSSEIFCCFHWRWGPDKLSRAHGCKWVQAYPQVLMSILCCYFQTEMGTVPSILPSPPKNAHVK